MKGNEVSSTATPLPSPVQNVDKIPPIQSSDDNDSDREIEKDWQGDFLNSTDAPAKD